jgi:alanine racemase
MVDVGDAAVAVGDRAILFGDPATGVPSASDWADAAGTINYKIVTRIGPRVERVYT